MTKKGESKIIKYRELIKIDKCARCGYNEFPCSLQVHHKDSDRDNNNTANLILLCANCHTALRYDRWKLSDIGLEDVKPAYVPGFKDWVIDPDTKELLYMK